MQQIDIPKLFSGCLGLTGFAVAILAGLAVDNTIESILFKAIVSMIVCSVLGMILGFATESALRDVLDPIDIPTTRDQQTANSQHAHAPAESGRAA